MSIEPESQLPDHYATLRIQPTASMDQVKRAYYMLAKRYHPDRAAPNRRGWAREQMARINVAYETLSDPHRRAEYDLLCGYAETVAGQAAHPSGRAVWRGQRVRERSRRHDMERWRTVSLASLGALALALVVTALLVRTPAGYLLAAGLVGSALGLLILSLVMANR